MRAQFVLSDDFESGTLLRSETPPGKWPGLTNPDPALESLAASAAAAHRGQRGLEVVDGRSMVTGPGVEARLDLTGSASSGALHVRFWHRVVVADPSRGVMLFRAGTGASEALSFYVYRGSSAGTLGGTDALDAYTRDTAPLADLGGWHLYEVSLVGLDTANGARRLWVDGQRAAERPGIDYRGFSIGSVSLGAAWETAREFTGTLHFDDFRIGASPHASRLVWVLPTGSPTGCCAAVTLELAASEGTSSVTAPYDVEADLSASGADSALFSDSDCTEPLDTAVIAQGESSTRLYLRAMTAGEATLTATHLDFLTGSAATAVTQCEPADGGCGAVRALAAGCGCHAAAGPTGVLLLALLARRRRRRSS
ncbi:MAG: hypothetical protein IPJ65_20670 [Archangiaceae bacterium]|nr:hypothetical protein [Archangiaceae bacterium]